MIRWIKGQIQNIKSASAFLGVVIPLCVIAFSAFQYVQTNDISAKQRKFENYHLIIERFGGGNTGSIFVTVANIYELRNYPEYREVSINILEDMQKNWATSKEPLVAREIKDTKKFLEAIE